MIPCFGCERAREMLDAYMDGELTIPDQVAIEVHLRTCPTCAARIEDAQLIGATLRGGSPVRPTPKDERALAGMSAGTLARIRAERDQALPARLRETFTDLRLFWPALGAIGSVLLGMAIALGMFHRPGTERPESLAAILHALANPQAAETVQARGFGTMHDARPLWFDAMIGPQLFDVDPASFDGLLDDGGVLTVEAMLDGAGRIDGYTLLGLPEHPVDSQAGRADALAMQEAMQSMRFAPALAADGSGLAVGVFLVMAKATARPAPPRPVRAIMTPAPVPSAAPADASDPMDEAPATLEYESGLSPRPSVPWT
jgi:hypothetical protein